MPFSNLNAGRTAIAGGFLALSVFSLPSGAQAQDMMSACAAEISAVCNGVSQGRGRISACLYANDAKLSAGCKSAVAEVTSSPTFRRYIPADAKSVGGSDETELRAACTAEADKVCTTVTNEPGRLLACLYSRSTAVSPPCWSAAKAIIY